MLTEHPLCFVYIHEEWTSESSEGEGRERTMRLTVHFPKKAMQIERANPIHLLIQGQNRNEELLSIQSHGLSPSMLNSCVPTRAWFSQ